MSATLALIRFELERRRLTFVVALVCGVFGFLLPFLPAQSDVPANELRTVAASATSVIFAVILALLLGASLFANDLAERRATFLFARPLGWPAIAVGRLAAALIVILGAAGLVLLPSLAAGARFELPTFGYELVELGDGSVLLALGALVLLLVTSAVVLSVRARTPWIALELAALVAGVWTCVRAVVPLRELHLWIATLEIGIGLGVLTLATLIVVFLAALARGRVDPTRAHRAQAIVVAIALAGTGVAALAWSHDYLNPTLGEVWGGDKEIVARALADGRVLIAGSERHRNDLSTAFLVDGKSGAWIRAGQGSRGGGYSLDVIDHPTGDYFWDRRGGELRLVHVAPGSVTLLPESTPIAMEKTPALWELNAGATQIATLVRAGGDTLRLEIHEMSAGRLISSTRFAGFLPWNARLGSEGDGFRLAFWRGEDTLESWRIDSDGHARSTGAARIEHSDFLWRLDAAHSRIFVKQSSDERRWLVLDAATLSRVAELRPALLDDPKASLSFLLASFPDGSFAVSARTDSQREIDLYSPSGELLQTTSAAVDGPTAFVGAGSTHTILLAWHPQSSSSDLTAGWVLDRYDLASGERRQVATDLRPISIAPFNEKRLALLRDAHGDLFSLDADSGALSRLARPKGVS